MGEDKARGSEEEAKDEPRRSSRRLVMVALMSVVVGVVIGGAGMRMTMHGHGDGKAEPATPSAKKPLYQCPMHPAITSDHPGDCPICGMKLVLVASAATESGSGAPVSGLAAVTIDPSRQQLIGLRTAAVTKGSIGPRVFRSTPRRSARPT